MGFLGCGWGGGGARRWRAEIGWLSVEEYVDPVAADVNVLFTGMFYRGTLATYPCELIPLGSDGRMARCRSTTGPRSSAK